jgi:hypothetical protein
MAKKLGFRPMDELEFLESAENVFVDLLNERLLPVDQLFIAQHPVCVVVCRCV